jgi:DNA-binding response OmpR family regulator
MRLLLVEDEEKLAEALAYILKKNKYGVDIAFDGETGQDMAESGVYDLIILDWMLPGKDGIAILKALRDKKVDIPIILLTAKDSVNDRVIGLDSGADDYLVKPFASEELLARIRALSRRSSNILLSDERRALGDIVFDPLQGEIIYGTEKTKLTLKESLLLDLLMRNAGQVLTKEQILDRVWGLDSDVETGTVELYIHYLRRKIHSKIVRIETIRGIGYSLKEV